MHNTDQTIDTMIVDDELPDFTDAELKELVADIDQPFTKESNERRQRILQTMLDVNRDAGVFQDVVHDAAPEENAVANNGKYHDDGYSFGMIGHRSDRSDI